MHTYGYVYICKVLGTSPNSFQTRIHEETRTSKGRFCNTGEKKKLIVNVHSQLTVQYNIRKKKERKTQILYTYKTELDNKMFRQTEETQKISE